MFSLFNFSAIFPGGQLTPFAPMCGRPWGWVHPLDWVWLGRLDRVGLGHKFQSSSGLGWVQITDFIFFGQ